MIAYRATPVSRIAVALLVGLAPGLARAQPGRAAAESDAGFAWLEKGRADSAGAAFGRALRLARAARDDRGEGRALDGLARVQLARGRVDSAIVLLHRSLAARRTAADSAGIGLALTNIATVHTIAERPDSARAYFTLALPLLRALGDSVNEGNALSSIGMTHRALGRTDSALAYFRRAEAIARAAGDSAGEATAINNIGLAFDDLRELELAQASYERALAIFRALGFDIDVAGVLGNLGVVQRWMGRPDSALAYYRQALPLQRAVDDPREEARLLHNIALVHGDRARADSALAYLRRALRGHRRTGDRVWEGMALHEIGRALARPGPGRNLAAAVARYDSAAAVFASVAARAGGDAGRLTFAERRNMLELFHDWSLAWLARAPAVGARRSAFGALAAAERGRAQALLELMRGRGEGGGGRGAWPRLVRGADLSAEGGTLARAATSGGAAALAYFAAGDTLVAWLMLPGGGVSVVRHAIGADSLATLVGEVRGAMGATTPLTRAVDALDSAAQRAAAAPSAAGSAAASRTLADLLIPAALAASGAREVVIVPHGPLGMVPFAALAAGADGEPLGARIAVRYAPSLGTLREVEMAARVAAASVRAERGAGGLRVTSALVVGNPTMPAVRQGSRVVQLEALPAAEREADSVAARLGSRVLLGGAATEDEVRRRLPGASVVHLATHGFAFATDARARQSFIALAPGAGRDGLLTVGEIIDEVGALRAELVVLSACQTGLGNLKQAEGTVGLQRAFLARGARSVLVSLWNVSDEATELLMRRFYAHWLDDADIPGKAEALRRAQEDVRAERRFADPVYWAAFQVVGAG